LHTNMDGLQWYPCETCDETFPSISLVESHMHEMKHYRTRCERCYQRLKTVDALVNHLSSGIHRESDILCPFCGSLFHKASTLISHFEEAKCTHAPGLNHHSVLWLVRNCDTAGVVTNPQAKWLHTGYLIAGLQDPPAEHKCFTCHRSFRSHQELETHLESPLANPAGNGPRFYRCPDKTGKCEKGFVCLAALIRHLEAQACGTMSFDGVQSMFQKMTERSWGQGIGAPKRLYLS
ncbi:uncharacterized protein N7496_005877, partial [Penicillium cataractarum]